MKCQSLCQDDISKYFSYFSQKTVFKKNEKKNKKKNNKQTVYQKSILNK